MNDTEVKAHQAPHQPQEAPKPYTLGTDGLTLNVGHLEPHEALKLARKIEREYGGRG